MLGFQYIEYLCIVAAVPTRDAVRSPYQRPGRDSTASLGAELLSSIARLNRWATHHADLEIPPAQGRLLALIESLGHARIGDLARGDHCSQPTMTTQVQRLVDQGWVRREVDPTDARATLVSLTLDGSTVLGRVREARARVVEPLIEELGLDGRQKLLIAVDALGELLAIASAERATPV
jgi:DNA-binding MarR family transcriptional regulator